MKHNPKITAILLIMFLVTQLIGLAVIYSYTPKTTIVYNQTTGTYNNVTERNDLPYGFQPPEMDPTTSLIYIVIAMVIAIVLILILMRFRAELFMRFWFFAVVTIALFLTINALTSQFKIPAYYVFILALPLAFFKIYKRNLLVHNITELLVYPGIAAILVPIFNIPAIIILLLAISVWDIYAVWHAGVMQKMAKFQINKVKVFGGFFIPYLGKKERQEVELLKQKYKNKIPDNIVKKKKIKINLAILGGGDVVFPLILAGVVLLSMGLISALLVTLFSTLALLFLFVSAKKGKFYPAMPFLTAGSFLGLLIAWLITFI